jgi:glutamate-ammonia-ligase adenylyltransferase
MNLLPDLPPQLAETAQNHWEALERACKGAGIPTPQAPSVNAALKRVFAFSEFAAKSCTRHPKMLENLVQSGDLERSYDQYEYAERVRHAVAGAEDEAALKNRLRLLRNREMVRIACRDLAGWANLSETMSALSFFADACLDHTLSVLYRWLCSDHGCPKGSDGSDQSLVVIGMGKLGGSELNYSSDIDLIFAYPEEGETAGRNRTITNEDFFLRLCRRLIRVIGETTADGMVFRVDMRLRPYGDYGPLVMSLDAMDSYYQRQGREWERYAWIKARSVAGDRAAGGRLIEMLKPFVYRRYLDFGAFESLRDMKQKISLEMRRKGIREDIKLGPGGIREIEFFGQVFQLIRGGVISDLQEQSILKVLKTLSRQKYIPELVGEELAQAYVFLRNTEHRLQEFSDQQTHKLPKDSPNKSKDDSKVHSTDRSTDHSPNHPPEHSSKQSIDRMRLAASMGYQDWDEFSLELDRHRKTVHSHFNGLLAQNGSENEKETEALNGVWQGLMDPEQTRSVLLSAGFNRPDDIVNLLAGFQNDLSTRALTKETRQRIDKLIPLLLKHVSGSPGPAVTLNRIVELIKAIEGRACYMALLLENPGALTHLVNLSTISPWVVSFLSHHPVLLDELLDPRTLYHPPEKTDLENELRQRIGRIDPMDLEYQMEALCVFKQSHTLRVAASDITGGLPLMKVSDHLSYIAETVLSEVLDLAWQYLTEKYGSPACLLQGESYERGFTIVAYGKLGGLELGYGSDLDLVFLHTGVPGKTAGANQSIDNSQFFARLGQRVIHILTAHTAAGVLYDIDMRLRPSGSSGILVSHIDAFDEYMMQKAWTWEHQALIRARAVAGDRRLASRFEKIRKNVIALPRKRGRLRDEVSGMRHRMRRELLKPEPGMFDLKQDTGGIVDIEFLVQYLVLLYSQEYKALAIWSDNVRQIQTLAETGVIDTDAAGMLKNAYLSYRSDVHRLSLQERPERVPESQYTDLRKGVISLWNAFLGTDG